MLATIDIGSGYGDQLTPLLSADDELAYQYLERSPRQFRGFVSHLLIEPHTMEALAPRR